MQVVKTFVKDHPHMWWGLFLPLYLAAFFIIEKFVTGPYWVTQLPADQLIPFCPYFIFFYMSWSPLLAVLGVYLILKDAEGFRRYIWMLALSFFSATVFCVLVPNCQELRPADLQVRDIFTWAVQLTYDLDTNTNVFPSVHVVGVIDAWFAIWHSKRLKKWTWRWGTGLYGLAVIASTMFIKQHAIIDVLAGLVLGFACNFVVYNVIGKRRDCRLCREA